MVERVPPFRIRVEHKASSLWAVLFIFLFFIGILFVLFLRSPLSHISKITITGNQILTKQEILQQSGIRLGMSFFGVKTKDVESNLHRVSAVKQITLDKQFPNTIMIKVEEYPVIAYIDDEQALIPLLANGAFLQTYPVTSMLRTMPVMEGWDKEKASFSKLTSQFAHLPASTRSQILTVQPLENKPAYAVLTTRREHKVEVRIDQLAERMKLYPKFLKQPPGTVHLLESVWFTPEH
ncbi:FtsQ-type POTRA domain-containing protein [Shimazuella sp. AN120528]|nr:FtsQ-type POTRA domain-containing protein [Shimazuella soli]